MKSFLIVYVGQHSYTYCHNISGEDFKDAVFNALNKNLEYFGNEPEGCSKEFNTKIIDDKRYLDNDKLKKYAKWHVDWINKSLNNSNNATNGFFVYDITNSQNVIQLEKVN